MEGYRAPEWASHKVHITLTSRLEREFEGRGSFAEFRIQEIPITLGLEPPLNLGLNQDAQWYTARGVEQDMTPQPYQNAYDTAVSELSEIAASFEQLRARKALLDAAVRALEPFFASTGEVPLRMSGAETEGHPITGENATGGEELPQEYSFHDVPNPLPDVSETGGDPFQRRVKSSFRFKGFATQRSL